ncbi:MAG: ribosomal protein S18-alanine N-acetyltransferase [Burkholderiales bacterium]|nr:ribosomal protein S18-alanine N-acetyltransferase [Burkholderiales bacterium]MDQ3195999.1 ribosomal protein S18-alanine N-acetyltransferase [Pseudomonadota bacterium]
MSALFKTFPELRPMRARDVETIATIERETYEFPWTRGNFRDSLSAGYSCRVMEADAMIIAYGILLVAVDEAHLLNLTVAAAYQRRGWGSMLLDSFIDTARECRSQVLLLEVRPSNHVGRVMYDRFGFRRIALRRGYYPAKGGREDAIVMGLPL